MLKLTNLEVSGFFEKAPEGGLKLNKSLEKIMNHGNLEGDKAYSLSLIVPALEKQNQIIEKNRNRISLNAFPDQAKLSGDELTKYMNDEEKRTKFFEELNSVFEKTVEIEGDKISLSREKTENQASELNKLNLTAVDLMALKPLIDIK